MLQKNNNDRKKLLLDEQLLIFANVSFSCLFVSVSRLFFFLLLLFLAQGVQCLYCALACVLLCGVCVEPRGGREEGERRKKIFLNKAGRP